LETFGVRTHAPEFWVETAESITVYLEPAPYLPPKIERCFTDFLDELQKEPLLLPDGSGRKFVLKLRLDEGFKLAIA
jgi:hypothetical protein